MNKKILKINKKKMKLKTRKRRLTVPSLKKLTVPRKRRLTVPILMKKFPPKARKKRLLKTNKPSAYHRLLQTNHKMHNSKTLLLNQTKIKKRNNSRQTKNRMGTSR